MEGSKGDAWISLGRGNRIYFTNGLGVGGNGNRKDQVGRDGGERILEETLKRGHLGRGRNLV